MVTKTIQITRLIASARRFNRLGFQVVNDDGTTTDVVYPRARNNEDDESLAVEDGIFSLAQAIYYSTDKAEERRARAQLYTNTQCCCCTKLHVEGILTLSPLPPANGQEPAVKPDEQPA